MAFALIMSIVYAVVSYLGISFMMGEFYDLSTMVFEDVVFFTVLFSVLGIVTAWIGIDEDWYG